FLLYFFIFFLFFFFFFSSRRRHTRFSRDWSSDVCSSDLNDRRSSVTSYSIFNFRQVSRNKIINNPTQKYGMSKSGLLVLFSYFLSTITIYTLLEVHMDD